MTAPKKNTSKSAKSPAPATKSAAKSVAPKPTPAKVSVAPAAPAAPAKKAVAKKPAAPVKAAPAPAPVAPVAPAPTKAVAVAPVPAPAPVVRPVVSQPVATVIQARIDIGFGNVLHIRGEGAGLSWDEGKLMDCIADDLWQVTLPESSRSIVFKFLVNDLSWNIGPDYTVAGGTSVTLTPEF